MKFLALLVALLLEQVRPLREHNRLYQSFGHYAAALDDHFNGGQHYHGVLAWLLVVAPLILVTLTVHYGLHRVSPLAAWAWNVGVLYLTMGFRQFSHHFTEILRVLSNEDLPAARTALGEWRATSAAEFSATEIARVSIEQGLLASHRHVFGTVAWFIVLGPAGAVLYRASEMLAGRWNAAGPGSGEFGRFAARFFFWLDWVPARLTALTFAVVGNFEDAIYCWRSQALAWSTHTQGVILAAGGGALGVRLGDTLHQHGTLQFRPELGTGNDAGVDAMEATIRLIWRSLVLWMFLVFLVSLAHALGG
ncbi:MAG TPA: CobD/CbiB family protein [Burkholderiales bacterium]|nr:CobD/CbiB family protein [Burkholderiales bacterium]